MFPAEVQALADASEADAAARYARWKLLELLVAEAIRRADAVGRLEIALQQPGG